MLSDNIIILVSNNSLYLFRGENQILNMDVNGDSNNNSNRESTENGNIL